MAAASPLNPSYDCNQFRLFSLELVLWFTSMVGWVRGEVKSNTFSDFGIDGTTRMTLFSTGLKISNSDKTKIR